MSDDDRAGRLMHGRPGLERGDPVALPLTMASMFHLPGDPAGAPGYGRVDNPVWEEVERQLSILEGAPALLFPSGMGAISAALMAGLKAGDRVLLPSDGYYTTRLLADRVLARFGVAAAYRPTARYGEGGFDGFAAVFVETPSNPGLDLCDLAAICAAVRAAGGVTLVDNTTMTPFGQRPLELGADVVVASDTKAPSGQSDVILGHLATRDAALFEAAKDWRKLSGAIPGPFEAWQLNRSLPTLEMRFARMCDSAEALAPRLAAHPAVRALRYPGLPDDPGHALARSQMARFGFLIGLTLKDRDTAERFIEAAGLTPATSFGGVHSSAECRARWGDDVPGGFVRLSVGCEPVADLSARIVAALDEIA
ncbi:cystathionine gamma-lyase [Wenxinia saemankumensis]|uniref:Cystathionine gamma-lyase n=1 Tax=Wenxinia saemankumensis TaxID=1447782 RepID=A0A1M6FU80_9RHOB|nr:cystathionine gamma-lyase [Wenxinia saemankumensis]SHJ01217.1 cystathionine gamma-lyase [Wenxinia saemankumensis]